MNEIEFKVKFLDRKSTWVTVSLTDDYTLRDLNDAIQDALGWMNDHLFEFIMEGRPYSPDCRSYQCESDDVDINDPTFLGFAERTKINTLKLVPKQKILYHFDFGDEHFFEVHVIEVRSVPKSTKPKITGRSEKIPKQYR